MRCEKKKETRITIVFVLCISLVREYWIIDYSQSQDHLTHELRILVGDVTT